MTLIRWKVLNSWLNFYLLTRIICKSLQNQVFIRDRNFTTPLFDVRYKIWMLLFWSQGDVSGYIWTRLLVWYAQSAMCVPQVLAGIESILQKAKQLGWKANHEVLGAVRRIERRQKNHHYSLKQMRSFYSGFIKFLNQFRCRRSFAKRDLSII